jgi:hypothetical protein
MTFSVDGRFAAWFGVALVLIVTPGPDPAGASGSGLSLDEP